MPYYRSVGEVPRKRHTQFRQPDGSLYAEELMGQEGFSSDSSLLYHRHLPTAIVAAEEFDPARLHPGAEPAAQAAPPAHPQARRRPAPTRCSAGSTCSPTTTCRISYVLADRPSPLYRNAIGDECLYVESGTAAGRVDRSACWTRWPATTSSSPPR